LVLRQTRLTARLLFATILVLAAFMLAYFGPDHLIEGRAKPGREPNLFPAWQMVLRTCLVATVTMLAHEQAARVKRWRRNIIRAGGVFATSWIGSLALALLVQSMQIAQGLGFDPDRSTGYAAALGLLILFRANLLPKSRPAWFNGVALPIFASRADIWCKVHRLAAIRLLVIGLAALGLAAFAPADVDPVQPIVILLFAELALSTLHALWLGATTGPRKETA
jgi:uncharacterized membrane protein